MSTTVQLPNPAEVAQREAAAINANRAAYLEVPIERVLTDSPFVDRDDLLSGITKFHAERMAKVPSATKFPESPQWVQHILAVDREVRRLASLNDQELAILRSLGMYLTFRGFSAARLVDSCSEKCRVAYIPDSEVGQIHIKNVDDPATHWKGERQMPEEMPFTSHLVEDGVGSGLHIDDEPDEIFPLPGRAMCAKHADDVPGAVEFYTRYSPFWGGCNIVLHDKQKRSVAIEKCSYNYMEVFKPDSSGRSHCSGMACRDPKSPQGKHQRVKRDEFLTRFNQPVDGLENVFWAACERAEQMLADFLKKADPKNILAPLVKLFRTPWPNGLSKEGPKLHARQAVLEYTLITHYGLMDRKKYVCWVRDAKTLKMPEEPIEVNY